MMVAHIIVYPESANPINMYLTDEREFIKTISFLKKRDYMFICFPNEMPIPKNKGM